jgi:hypothetical protein
MTRYGYRTAERGPLLGPLPDILREVVELDRGIKPRFPKSPAVQAAKLIKRTFSRTIGPSVGGAER